MIALEQARHQLESLGPKQAVEILANTLDVAASENLTYPEMLEQILGSKVEACRERYLSPNPPKGWHWGSCMRDYWYGRANDPTHWPTDRVNGGPGWTRGIQGVARRSAEDLRWPGWRELGEAFDFLVGETVSLGGDGVKRAVAGRATGPTHRRTGFSRASPWADAG